MCRNLHVHEIASADPIGIYDVRKKKKKTLLLGRMSFNAYLKNVNFEHKFYP